jgi:hypothetical protein
MSSNNNTPAISALVLVPIAIAASAAYVALKTTVLYQHASRFCSNLWHQSRLNPAEARRRRRLKLSRSDISSTQVYADSWVDLESITSQPGISAFIDQSPPQQQQRDSEDKSSDESETPSRVWHPPRHSRLAWSFADPRAPNHRRSGSSSVARPLPVVPRPERSSAEDADADFRVARISAWAARRPA